MKKIISLFIACLISYSGIAQNPALTVKKFVLDNGFTVYLNEDKTAKEVYGAVVVKAGSKNDPADATGMAHYLEHLLFKGTTQLGTTDYEKEKPFLDSINIYYDQLGNTKDKKERQRIQQLINNQSVQASKFSLPTEFDKLVKGIGGTGLNAYTTEDMTVYHNSFPGEQMEKWLDIYSHRFQNPVFRSFQSELEVVYEEKNRGLDAFQTKLIEEMNKNLFKYHPYGTQSTIGTVEHLKNPSLTKIYEYFNTYYVANNMALVLCGNFDSEKIMPLIVEKFLKLRTGVVPVFPKFSETIYTKKQIKKVRYSPVKVALIGFKTVPVLHEDNAALEVFNSLLSNESESGKLNKLQREGKFTFAGSFNYSFNDDGAVMFFVVPKIVGQSIKKAEKLVFAEIEKIKKGDISDRELQIIKTELYRQQQQSLENHRSRTFNIVQTFGHNSTWEYFLKYNAQLINISKEDVIRVANKYFGDNYFALHSNIGFPKKETLKKPGYKPVITDQKEESVYAKSFKLIKSDTIIPVFLDFDKDATLIDINESNKLYVTPNPINDIFTLALEYQIGSDSMKKLDLAADMFNYFHVKDMNLDTLKEEFALVGLTSYAYCGDDRLYIFFTGIEGNLTKSLQLINKLINEAEVDEKYMKILRNDILTGRKATEKEPSTLGNALYDYSRFGNKSSYINRLSKKELKNLTANELLGIYKKAMAYNVVWHYAGTERADKIKELLTTNISISNYKKAVPLRVTPNTTYPVNTVYLVGDKKAVQSQVYFLVNSDSFSNSAKSGAISGAFNKYMSGGFSGLIAQEIREFRSLAYSTYGYFISSGKLNKQSYFYSFIGCQADKTNEAIEVMTGLINNMPKKPERMDDIKLMLKNSTSADYPDFRYISYSINYYRQLGDTTYKMKDIYANYDNVTFDDIEKMYETYIKNRPMVITIYGNKSKLDMSKIAQYGKIVELKRKDIIRD